MRNKHLFFAIFVFIIFLLALFFRLYDYPYRISIESDNTRDVMIGRYAFDHAKLPLIGQFASGGPFFYGPWWYWFLAVISIFPWGIFTYWYTSTILSLLFVLLIYFLGKKVGGKPLGLTAAFFAAISPAQINISFSVWNPSIIPLLSLILIILLLRCYEKSAPTDFFFFGFIMGLALTIHFQSLLLVPIIISVLLMARFKIKNYLSLFIGLAIPFIPLIIFDLRYNWFNFRNIYQYLTVEQFKIWVPNRWLLYVFKYWPDAWSMIIGGKVQVAGIIILLAALMVILKIPKLNKNKKFFLIIFTFFFEIILYRYYRGERFFYYSFFAHPYVLFITAWSIREIYCKNKYLGLALLLLITISTIIKNVSFFQRGDINIKLISQAKKEIYQKYPDDSFNIYACNFNEGNFVSYPLSYMMYREGRNSLQGKKIGVCFTHGQPISFIELTDEEVVYRKDHWFNRTTEHIYKDTVEWWKINPPVK